MITWLCRDAYHIHSQGNPMAYYTPLLPVLTCPDKLLDFFLNFAKMSSGTTVKRKQPSSETQRSGKRVKTSSARTVLAQSSDRAVGKDGELDVSAFIKAREFEIKAMEASMGSSKNAPSARAFQQLPNALRRRTASHNVKRVPKRLRARAKTQVSGKARQGWDEKWRFQSWRRLIQYRNCEDDR